MDKNRVFEEKIENKVLYHYTTLETFFSIVKSGEFRLFDITKSNDPLEGKFAINALAEAYRELYGDEEINNEEYHVAHASFFQFECNNDSSKERTCNLYAAASFCDTKHEMTMLRCYANNGKGVAIGFSGSKLVSLVEKTPGMEFRKIEYLTDEEMKARARKFWLDYFGTCNGQLPCISDEKAMEPLVEKIEEFAHEGYFIKHIVNKDEEEYRLLYCKKKLFKIRIFSKDVEDKIDFICESNDIKTYYTIPINCVINDVYIGPASDVTPAEMRAFLDKHKIEVNYPGKITWVSMK